MHVAEAVSVVPDGAVAIPVGKHHVAWVDAEDAPLVQQYKWNPLINKRRHTIYAQAAIRDPATKQQRTIYMHRLVLGLTFGDGMGSDHADHDGLNNRRSNVRVATRSQNARNISRRKPQTAPVAQFVRSDRFKGVYHQGWVTTISRAARRRGRVVRSATNTLRPGRYGALSPARREPLRQQMAAYIAQDLTLAEIGERLGTTGERARQIITTLGMYRPRVCRLRPQTFRWRAVVCVEGRRFQAGPFGTEEEAAMAYNVLARRHHGEFACLNAVEMG